MIEREKSFLQNFVHSRSLIWEKFLLKSLRGLLEFYRYQIVAILHIDHLPFQLQSSDYDEELIRLYQCKLVIVDRYYHLG